MRLSLSCEVVSDGVNDIADPDTSPLGVALAIPLTGNCGFGSAREFVRGGLTDSCSVTVEGGTAGHTPSIVPAGNLNQGYETIANSKENLKITYVRRSFSSSPLAERVRWGTATAGALSPFRGVALE